LPKMRGKTMSDDPKDVVRGALEAQAADVTERFGAVFEAHHGQTEPEVLAALKGACAEINWEPTDDFLLPYARAIAAGHRVLVEYEGEHGA
jgi:hypothetical protein